VPGDAGSAITFDRILLVGDGDAVTVGTPVVEGATVSGTVLGEALGPKLIVFKFKQKATYRRKNGHRQHLTRVRIDEISAGVTRAKGAKATGESEPAAADAPAPTEAAAKPTRTRKPAAKAAKADADATDETKPKTTRRRAPAKKAEAEE
jgi:large subunit ribosomal protein L21